MSRNDLASAALDWACQQPGLWHDSGNLGGPALERIFHHAERVGARRTAETGCGLSTIVLSNIAETHLCFTIAAGDSLEKVQAASHMRHERTTFVVGPSQLTLPNFSFANPLDLVLIDGAHAFPFAQLDYFFLYPHIRRGGVIVLDDVHIPTVGQMCDFMREDKMWRHLEDVGFTAFFERTEASLFDPFGDGWWLQRYNAHHFEPKESLITVLGEQWWER